MGAHDGRVREPSVAAVAARELTDDELALELGRRGKNPQCTCQRWQTYLGAYDSDGQTWRCRGCLRSIQKCTCS
jgi:hypothetical protein